MWQNWLNGILGLWVVLIPFLNFSLAWQRTVLIFSGIVIAILGFWSFYKARLLSPSAKADGGPAHSLISSMKADSGLVHPQNFSEEARPALDILNRQAMDEQARSLGGEQTENSFEKKIEI